MADELKGRRIAILATDGVEQVELTDPVKSLRDCNAKVDVLAPRAGSIQGFKHHDKGSQIPVDRALDQARAEEYDGLVLPGGVINGDALRLDTNAVAFVKHFVESGKPIAAICHGPWILINAGGVKGRRMTAWT